MESNDKMVCIIFTTLILCVAICIAAALSLYHIKEMKFAEKDLMYIKYYNNTGSAVLFEGWVSKQEVSKAKSDIEKIVHAEKDLK